MAGYQLDLGEGELQIIIYYLIIFGTVAEAMQGYHEPITMISAVLVSTELLRSSECENICPYSITYVEHKKKEPKIEELKHNQYTVYLS